MVKLFFISNDVLIVHKKNTFYIYLKLFLFKFEINRNERNLSVIRTWCGLLLYSIKSCRCRADVVTVNSIKGLWYQGRLVYENTLVCSDILCNKISANWLGIVYFASVFLLKDIYIMFWSLGINTYIYTIRKPSGNVDLRRILFEILCRKIRCSTIYQNTKLIHI